MYRCEVCDRVVPPNTPCNRAVEYPTRPKVHWVPPNDRGKGKWVDDPGGHGTEIVREVYACPKCAISSAA